MFLFRELFLHILNVGMPDVNKCDKLKHFLVYFKMINLE